MDFAPEILRETSFIHPQAFKRTATVFKQKLHAEEQRKEISLKFWVWAKLGKKISRQRLKQKFMFSGMFFARAQAKTQKSKLLGEVWT